MSELIDEEAYRELTEEHRKRWPWDGGRKPVLLHAAGYTPEGRLYFVETGVQGGNYFVCVYDHQGSTYKGCLGEAIAWAKER